jgi:hypothetical protein
MRYETMTRLAPAEALAAAERLFRDEYGLRVRAETPRSRSFEGGGGYVAVAVVAEHPTTLEIETREWDALVAAFIKSLPR